MKTPSRSTNLLAVVLAVGLCTVFAPMARAGVAITPASGFSITWDGNEGDYFSAADPAWAPTNVALAPGVTAFGSSAYPNPAHTIAHINDSRYGNSNSWLADPGDGSPYIGLNLARVRPLTAIAWGRDNGNNVTDACGGQCTDRSLGLYTLQYTQVPLPGTGTPETGNAATGWANLGTLDYQSNDDPVIGGAFTSYFRHQYSVTTSGGTPVAATGVRIKPPNNSIAMDELELYYQDPRVPASGLAVWLEAEQGVVQGAPGEVGTWADQSGAGNDAAPPGAAPFVVPTGLPAGSAAVHFDGTDRRLNLPNTSTLGIQNSDYEIFVAARSGSPAIQFLASSTGLEEYELHLNGSSGARFIPKSPYTTQATDIGASGEYTDNFPHLFNARVDGGTSYIRVNGVESADTAAGAQSAVNAVMSLGIRASQNNFPLNGDIGEVLIFNRALTPTERTAVEEYISGKWLVPLSETTLAETGGGPVALNVAAQSRGGTAFAKDVLAHPNHNIAGVNNEAYGNTNSWIGGTDPSFVGVAFDNHYTIDGIAFGRDNTGTYSDRTDGLYSLQYTRVMNPDETTPDEDWITISNLLYGGGFPDATGSLRHLWKFDPISGATGVRILTDSAGSTIAIDELEVSAIPEPAAATLLLVGLAACGLVAVRRRRR